MKTNRMTVQVPTWALGFITNGDPTGLSEEEIEQINEFLFENYPKGFAVKFVAEDPYSYFCQKPMIGQPTDVFDMIFYEM